MNNSIINEMFESEESGEMYFNTAIRNAEDEFDVHDFVHDLNELEEQRNKNVQADDIFLDDDFIEELAKEMDSNTCPETQKKGITQDDDFLLDEDFIQELAQELGLNNTNAVDIYDEYNKLMYQGEEYFVKKKNTTFPICVMNSKLVQVGIIREDDINNIVLL